MDTKDFIQLAKKRRTTVIGITLVFVIIGLLITLAQPLKYRSKSRLLILQPDTAADAYAIARSNQYVGGLISEVIYSGAFLDSLNSSTYSFDRSLFKGDYKQNIKLWKKTVFARSGGDTGVIDIEIYNTNPDEAKNISLAVNQLIISGQSPYKFNANQTKITVIDEPIVSSFPVKPNIAINLGMSILFGFLSGCSYIYLFPKKKLSEKLAKEIFGTDEIKIKKHQPAIQNFQPVYAATQQTQAVFQSAPIYAQKIVPENLPVFAQDNEAEDEIGQDEGGYYEEEDLQTPEDTATANFKGNINNVLGE